MTSTRSDGVWDVHGHDHAIDFLKRSLDRGMLAHAYLFLGPAGIGKSTLARALAQAINCPDPEPPCLQCSSCTRIRSGNHADIHPIERSGTGIGIDQIRALQHTASLKPFEGRAHVFIIDGAETLTREAANALLKALEEPPDDVYLLLLATDEEAIPETVRSRCQRVSLQRLPYQEVLAALQEEGTAEETAEQVARLARGRIGWALNTARVGALVEERRERLKELMALTRATLTERLRHAERLAAAFARDRDAVLDDMALWLEGWRDLLVAKEGAPDLALTPELLPQEETYYSLAEILQALEELRQTTQALQANVNARLALEALMLALPQRR